MKNNSETRCGIGSGIFGIRFCRVDGIRCTGGADLALGKYCMQFTVGGSDCSFTSYAECQATASGQDAECYGDTVRDDRLAAHNSMARKH
jgi:Protein of unknown function (DUF3551)